MSDEPRFLDSNILLRYLTKDDERKAERAYALLRRIEQGGERVTTSLLVVFEVVFTLERSYRVPKQEARDLLVYILTLPGVQLAGKALCIQALDDHVNRNVSLADAWNAAFMRSLGLHEIYTWDTDFDRFPGISRVEPL